MYKEKAQAIIKCVLSGMEGCINIIASDMPQLAKEALMHITWEMTRAHVRIIQQQRMPPEEHFNENKN